MRSHIVRDATSTRSPRPRGTGPSPRGELDGGDGGRRRHGRRALGPLERRRRAPGDVHRPHGPRHGAARHGPQRPAERGIAGAPLRGFAPRGRPRYAPQCGPSGRRPTCEESPDGRRGGPPARSWKGSPKDPRSRRRAPDVAPRSASCAVAVTVCPRALTAPPTASRLR